MLIKIGRALIKVTALSIHGWEADMPLKKSTSKNAFAKNVKTEMASGKPQKQAVAIAYSVQRKAAAPKKGK
jgi:hypothetical protein